MKRRNWYWDLNMPLKKIKEILRREDDGRFPRLAGTLLARVQNPAQVFEWITPSAFCRHYRAIQKEIASDAWSREKSAFWKATYLRLSRQMKEKGERIRRPFKMKLDDFDRMLIVKIKESRKAALLSQKELAEFMGYSQQYISGIEKGRERVSLFFLRKLVEVTRQPMRIVIDGEHASSAS